MIKKDYFSYTKKGGVRLLIVGDYSDLKDVQRIRDFAESIIQERKNASEQYVQYKVNAKQYEGEHA